MNFIVPVPEKVEPFLHLKCVVVSSINLYFTWVDIWFSFKKIKCSFCQQDRLCMASHYKGNSVFINKSLSSLSGSQSSMSPLPLRDHSKGNLCTAKVVYDSNYSSNHILYQNVIINFVTMIPQNLSSIIIVIPLPSIRVYTLFMQLARLSATIVTKWLVSCNWFMTSCRQ